MSIQDPSQETAPYGSGPAKNTAKDTAKTATPCRSSASGPTTYVR